MKPRMLLSAGVAAMSLAWSAPAAAAPLIFLFNGPSGTATFRLDSNPTPDFTQEFLGSDNIGFNNVPGVFGGVPGNAQVVSFGRGPIYAAFNLTAPNIGFTQFSGPELFTGPLSSPEFKTGSFTLINPFFGNGNLTITAVPEPATWAMMIAGFGLVGGALRYRRRRTTVAFS